MHAERKHGTFRKKDGRLRNKFNSRLLKGALGLRCCEAGPLMSRFIIIVPFLILHFRGELSVQGIKVELTAVKVIEPKTGRSQKLWL